jgi:hypothetical protein
MPRLSLTRVGIDGFRGLRALALEDLGLINILVGGNNSGKTSVLEALSIICQPLNPDEWLAMVRRRDFGGLDETRLQSLRWCFTRDRIPSDADDLVTAHCEFESDGDFPLRKLHCQYSEFFGVPGTEDLRRLRPFSRRPEELESEPMRGAELVQEPQWLDAPLPFKFRGRPISEGGTPTLKVWEYDPGRFTRPPRGARIECQTLTPYSYQINRNQVRSQSKTIFEQDSPGVLDLLRDFDADIDGIDLASFVGDRPAVYLKHRRLGIAPLSIFGDAMRRSVLLAATLPRLRDGGILLIDEVETGIHVRALSRVFDWLVAAARKLGVQVFVTTHSLEALDALISAPSASPADDVVAFHLTPSEAGTACKRFAGDLLHRLRFERGLDVR